MADLQGLKSKATGTRCTLFSSLEDIILDHSGLRHNTSSPWGKQFFDYSDQLVLVADAPRWRDRNTPNVNLVELFSNVVPPTRVCLNLELAPLTIELKDRLNSLKASSITFHQVTLQEAFEDLPDTNSIILDVHPYYSTPKERLGVYQSIVDQTNVWMDPKPQYTIMVKQEEWRESEGKSVAEHDDEGPRKKNVGEERGASQEGEGEGGTHLTQEQDVSDDGSQEDNVINEGRDEERGISEADFRQRMNEIVSSIEGHLGPVDLKWGFIDGEEGRVKGCQLCTSQSTTSSALFHIADTPLRALRKQ